jgi:RNA ligase (TIGR02306 family)
MENQNSVAYVGKIGSVVEIPGADNIELVLVGGWQAITKKGEYQEGDLVVVATTDAIIPQELSDKIGVTSYLRKGQRVRTVKLKGVYSECLIISPKYIPGYGDQYYEGMDMMKKMEITKYEPPVKMIPLGGGRKYKYYQNSNFHVYYKFPNIKNVPGIFTEEDNVVITRKIHGTNARYGIVRKKNLSFWDKIKKMFGNKWVDFEYVYGSHNVEKGSDSQGFYDTDVWRSVAEIYGIRKNLWKYVKKTFTPNKLKQGFIIYGEIYGKGIQKNYEYGLNELRFAGFDVEIDSVYQPSSEERLHFNRLCLPTISILYTGPWSQQVQDKYVYNNFIYGTKVPHEGIVVKSFTGSRSKVAKVINPDYYIYSEKNNVGDSH